MDFASLTLKDLLEKSFGAGTAGKVLQEGNEAFQKGLKGQDLVDVFRNVLKQDGHDLDSEASGVVFGFVRIV